MTEGPGILLHGSAAEVLTPAQIIGHIITVATEKQFTIDERVKFMQDMYGDFSPKYTPTPKYPESIAAVQQRYTVKKDGYDVCVLCDKCTSKDHESSSMHTDRCAEMVACDEMIGCCSLQSIRRFSRIGAGMMVDISQKAFLDLFGGQREHDAAHLVGSPA